MGWLGLGEEVDGFVSTTSDYGTARYFFGRYSGGYIYKIKASRNLIDVSKTLGRHYRHKSEYEYAVKDIPMDQVMGWYTFSLGGHLDGDFEANDDAFYKKNAPSLSSRKYNEKYGGQTDGGAQNSVAGFPENHEAWTESPWKEISPYKSKKAKNAREILKE
ncbi:ADP-ribosylation [Aaosphaeria arxii CBS 175.79]|uniref:ADP-ribosylation n=1 Tax=Aaosphaeria arxii CBS 175.79 TaxID=1450172 RepID=A0A6A5XN35_9PLEO|nr:ADP-ribosylation [Aaosphaeria arxii CBS 175.79]KAF2014685.1 ADP-ribosylation [Aaosphaeria arxii CBS 175.79]